MDKHELKQRIQEVAIIKELKPTKSPQHNRLAKEIVTELDEDGNEIEVEREVTENPTLGFELVALKEQHRLCELGCGNVVSNQVIETRLLQMPEKHWRTKCVNCGLHRSPIDGTMIDRTQIQNVFWKYFYHKNK